MPLPSIDWPLLGFTALKIAGAYALSLPIGWWGEREGHAVGIRTFPIVAIASCGYLLIFHEQTGPDGLAARSRLLQGLVTGIGFVGGGAIVRHGVTVEGTATAASIWNTGAIGAAVAMDHYEIAIVLAAFNLATFRGLIRLKRRLDKQPIREVK
jgi:putative Mg2+ transporter-C (MgtC) family protein